MTLRRRMAIGASLLCLATGGFLVGQRVWLAGKAVVAGRLIERAFAAHLIDGGIHPPWDWADMHPIARIEIPRLGIERTVLSGATGSSLAFGPGHVHGTAQPNARGNCVLAGHRDSWFAFLERLEPGDVVFVHTRGRSVRYEVESLAITDQWDSEVLTPSADGRLTLLTCYPFGGLTRGPLRFVVRCRANPLETIHAIGDLVHRSLELDLPGRRNDPDRGRRGAGALDGSQRALRDRVRSADRGGRPPGTGGLRTSAR